jgi:ArsR family metal-binding transcriptional regulator
MTQPRTDELGRFLNIDVEEFAVVLLVYPDGMVALHSSLDDDEIRETLRTVADTMPDEGYEHDSHRQ